MRIAQKYQMVRITPFKHLYETINMALTNLILFSPKQNGGQKSCFMYEARQKLIQKIKSEGKSKNLSKCWFTAFKYSLPLYIVGNLY